MSAVIEKPINTSFSLELPALQLVIDQTSLGLFKECPRKYYYRMVEGWTTRGTSVHLQFGDWFHKACETYERVKSEGADHQQALRAAVRGALAATWDKALGKPWNSEHKDKNRYTLIRSIIWYLDTYALHNPARVLMFPSGRPAVELTFKYTPHDPETGEEVIALTGEPIMFSGHLDAIILMGDTPFIADHKTTSRRLGPEYFSAYTPDNQFSMYAYAGKWAFNIDVGGVICDAIKVTQKSTEFERQVIYRTDGQLREWFADTKYYIQLMGRMAERNRWPQNDKACFLCQYRPVCARDPGARQKWLETDYVKEIWDPAVRRGE